MRLRIQLITLLLLSSKLFATTPNLVVTSKTYADGVAIRWTPSNYDLWQKWCTTGYRLERFTVSEQTKDNHSVLIGGKTILPFSDVQLDSLAKSIPTAALVQTCLYKKAASNSKSELLQQHEENSNCYLYSMLALQKNMALTVAAGLGTIDQTTLPNTVYLYKLYPLNCNSNDTQYLLINTNVITEYNKISDFNGRLNNNQITFEWDASFHTKYYFAYQIERSVDSGKTFQTINELPLLPSISDENKNQTTYYFDTLFKYNQWILYQIRGIDYFGQLGLPSPIDTIIAYYETQAYPKNVETSFPSQNNLQINWQFEESEEVNIKGFRISMRDSSEGTYSIMDSVLIPKDKRQYNLEMNKSNCYIRINALSYNDNLHPSFQTLAQQVDSMPPAISEWIATTIDSNGIATLMWNRNKANGLLSYRLYKANNRNDEYAVLTPHYFNDTIYKDTISIDMIRDSIYYKISSIDKRYNESQLSKVAAIAITNKIPPAPPLIHAFENNDAALKLNWTPSNSSGNINHQLKIVNMETGELTTKNLTINDTIYTDSTLQGGISYSISLIAHAQNGLYSRSAKAIEIKRPITTWMPAIEMPAIYNDTLKKQVDLIWNYPYDSEVKHYRIVAKTNDGLIKTIGTVEGGKTYYTHYYLKPYTMNTYYIIAYFKDGRRSKA